MAAVQWCFVQFVFLMIRMEKVIVSQKVFDDSKDLKGLKNSYDFIIVGAGSAGSVLANRLSEESSVNVLLLEAGGDEDQILNEIPMLAPFLQNTKCDWKYKTEKQISKIFEGYEPEFKWPRGRGLGGSSSMDYMVYSRGNKLDYDKWNKIAGRDWSWKSVLSHFLKSEDFTDILDTVDEYHNSGGYLSVSHSNSPNPMTEFFLSAGQELGMPIRDVNGEFQTGIMETQVTMRNGTRCSANKAFLKSLSNRQNLHIVTGALVLKVLFNTNNLLQKQAIAVKFQAAGITFVINATKEIILSAGTINSPQLLMLSGIGPKAHLEKLNISLLADLPGVGANLQDHLSITGIVYTQDGTFDNNGCPITPDLSSSILEWSNNKSGFLTKAIEYANGFISSNKPDQSEDWPDIDLVLVDIVSGMLGEVVSKIYNIPNLIWKHYYEPVGSEKAFLLTPILMRPKSRGTIRLRSINPTENPIIDPKYYSDQDDVELAIEGLKIALKFVETKAFKAAGIKLNMRPFPLCITYEQFSDSYLECLVKYTSVSSFHPVGTCKMSSAEDPMGVVDSKLRVRNVTGLRVIDASIMPSITTGNTNAPTIMIGEKGVDFIKQRWNIPTSRF